MSCHRCSGKLFHTRGPAAQCYIHMPVSFGVFCACLSTDVLEMMLEENKASCNNARFHKQSKLSGSISNEKVEKHWSGHQRSVTITT